MKARRPAPRITREAVAAFARLKAAPTRDSWWDEHNKLHAVVGAKLWQWPCVEPPGAVRNYRVDPEAVELWLALDAALVAATTDGKD
jgi:hypothetical protein